MAALTAGSLVNPNVRLIEPIAEGGMGSVWLAEHLSLKTRVAVKLIAPALAGSEPSLRQRFEREAAICAQIRSIHVVQVFDHGLTADGTPYIVMELLDGCPLTHRIESGGPMSPREVGMVVSQVAKVLHRAHVLGIVHRDIKPDNIFLIDSDYELFVKVLDFGIAKQTRTTKKGDTVTKTGAVVGTLEFMSPEQAVNSKHIGFQSDLWSLGVVAYYSLTGELPFDEQSTEPIWLQMSQGKMIAATARRADLPRSIDGWFAHALRPNPGDRYQSARVMAEDLAVIVHPDRHQVLDELSSSMGDGEGDTRRLELVDGDSSIADEDSHPAMFDLFGPDSERWGVETVVMNEQDHQRAEQSAQSAGGASSSGSIASVGGAGAGSSPEAGGGAVAGYAPLPGGRFAPPPAPAAAPSAGAGPFAPTALSPGGSGGSGSGGSRDLAARRLGARRASLLAAALLLAVAVIVMVALLVLSR